MSKGDQALVAQAALQLAGRVLERLQPVQDRQDEHEARAEQHLNQAVVSSRKSGVQDYLFRGLLDRAALYRDMRHLSIKEEGEGSGLRREPRPTIGCLNFLTKLVWKNIHFLCFLV